MGTNGAIYVNGGTISVDSSNVISPLDADPAPLATQIVTTDLPSGYSPQQIRAAYGLPPLTDLSPSWSGAGQTIAIVVAYNNPDLRSNLEQFDARFGMSRRSAGTPTGPKAATAAASGAAEATGGSVPTLLGALDWLSTPDARGLSGAGAPQSTGVSPGAQAVARAGSAGASPAQNRGRNPAATAAGSTISTLVAATRPAQTAPSTESSLATDSHSAWAAQVDYLLEQGGLPRFEGSVNAKGLLSAVTDSQNNRVTVSTVSVRSSTSSSTVILGARAPTFTAWWTRRGHSPALAKSPAARSALSISAVTPSLPSPAQVTTSEAAGRRF